MSGLVRVSSRPAKKQKHKRGVYKVHRVKDWHGFPSKERSYNLVGYSRPEDGSIWVLATAPQGVIEHERFHSIKNHSETPRTYKTYLDHELEAEEYAWKRAKSPPHIKMKFRGMLNSCVPYIEKGQATGLQVLQYMKRKIASLKYPEAWRSDFAAIYKEANEAIKSGIWR